MKVRKKQQVKREDRLSIPMTLIFPDINRGKLYDSELRRYAVTFDKNPAFDIDQDSVRNLKINIKLRTAIEVKRMFGSSPKEDSIFRYRVGNNFAELVDQKGFVKRVEIKFDNNNELLILDDFDFENVTDISK